MRPEAYGEHFADVYDAWYDASLDSDEATTFLAARAGAGPILELGVGTGRIAIRLAQLGHAVTGVDISEAMLSKLREKEDGNRVHTVLGSMTDIERLGTFSLIYIVFNGLFALHTPDEQASLFKACCAALGADALLVIEAHVPSSKGLSMSGQARVVRMTESMVLLEATRLDEPNQRLDLQLIELSEAGTRLFPASLRYAYQNEMELMASAAGLTVAERLANWKGDLAPAGSQPSITTYRRLDL